MGQYAQQQQQAVQRRALLLGAAAVLASGAPWLGRGQAALAQEFECDPQAAPNGIKWCDIATGFGAPAAAGAPGGGAAAAAAPCLRRPHHLRKAPYQCYTALCRRPHPRAL